MAYCAYFFALLNHSQGSPALVTFCFFERGYTVGTFDLLHVGYLALLECSKSLGGVLAVGVASGRVVDSCKPNVPVIPLEQRMEMLRALRCVDIVRPYDELGCVSGCKELNADIFVVGEGWGSSPHNLAVEFYLKSKGGQVKPLHIINYDKAECRRLVSACQHCEGGCCGCLIKQTLLGQTQRKN